MKHGKMQKKKKIHIKFSIKTNKTYNDVILDILSVYLEIAYFQ